MEDLIKVVQTLGFPIFVAGYLLLRYEKKLDKTNSYLLQLLNLLKAKVDVEEEKAN